MNIKQYDPKVSLSYLTIVSDFLRQYKDIKTTMDVINLFGVDRVTDITDTPEREYMKNVSPLPRDFSERAFQFRESPKRRGVIEATFHKSKLVNLRAQMFFYGWLPRRAGLKFITRELYPTVASTIDVTGTIEEHPYPAFYWSDFHGLYVRIGLNIEYAYVSTWLTDTDYLTQFPYTT